MHLEADAYLEELWQNCYSLQMILSRVTETRNEKNEKRKTETTSFPTLASPGNESNRKGVWRGERGRKTSKDMILGLGFTKATGMAYFGSPTPLSKS